MFAIANDDFFDFLERAGIYEDASSGDGIAPGDAVFCKFDALAIFEKKNFAGDDAELMSEGGVAEEMSIFTVNGNEIFGLDELEKKLLFFLAGVSGNVNGTIGIVIVDQGAAAEHVVEHAEDGFFVSGNDARGEDDGVVFVDGDEAMIIDGDAGHG